MLLEKEDSMIYSSLLSVPTATAQARYFKFGLISTIDIDFFIFYFFKLFGCPMAYGVPRPGIRSEPQSLT